MISNLIYIHIGNNLPEYIFDSIYQTILVSPTTKIYILLNDNLIQQCIENINKFNINIYTKNKISFELNIQCIPLSILTLPQEYIILTNNLPEQIKKFRNSFWIYTIARFFYLENFMSLFKINSAFHIENDIMIYKNLEILQNDLDINKIYMIKDSKNPPRVIASIMFFNILELNNLLSFIINQLQLNPNLNDMQILGNYISDNVEYFPFKFNDSKNYIMDSCAIGQYIGGVDPRNLPNFDKMSFQQKQLIIYNNPSKKFINETCNFKINNNLQIINKKLYTDHIIFSINFPYIFNNKSLEIKSIMNMHIHSKQLYQFSSIFDIMYKDIISGDRICSLCDFIITTPEIYNYHNNLHEFVNIDNIIIISDFKKLDIEVLNKIFLDFNKTNIKLFIYTRILDNFVENILFKLNKKLKYTIYLHNSDHSLENNINYKKLNNATFITKVYSQNINCELNDKFELLPIGIANNIFNHGNILTLYSIMAKNYKNYKTKNLYININPNTFAYRKNILDQVSNDHFNINKTPKPFKEYLEELSTHRFSLCVRGNGIDTHRFYESLYLGVIPVIINNKYTNNSNNVQYMKKLQLPFFEITSESFDKYSDEFFNEILYKKIIKECGSSIYNLPQLKLSYYN